MTDTLITAIAVVVGLLFLAVLQLELKVSRIIGVIQLIRHANRIDCDDRARIWNHIRALEASSYKHADQLLQLKQDRSIDGLIESAHSKADRQD
jgi:HAMP domain-containing protein